MKWFNPIIRICRYNKGLCVVCGKYAGNYWYCGIECACYDKTFSVRGGWIECPSFFSGCTQRGTKRE